MPTKVKAKPKAEKVYRIKPLKWKQNDSLCWIADSVVGVIKIWQWVPEISSDTTWHIDRFTGYPNGQSLAQAKAAAERWYRRQILKALVEVKEKKRQKRINPMTTIDQDRAAFEVYFGATVPLKRHSDGTYTFMTAHTAWNTWQAALEYARHEQAEKKEEVGRE